MIVGFGEAGAKRLLASHDRGRSLDLHLSSIRLKRTERIRWGYGDRLRGVTGGYGGRIRNAEFRGYGGRIRNAEFRDPQSTPDLIDRSRPRPLEGAFRRSWAPPSRRSAFALARAPLCSPSGPGRNSPPTISFRSSEFALSSIAGTFGSLCRARPRSRDDAKNWRRRASRATGRQPLDFLRNGQGKSLEILGESLEKVWNFLGEIWKSLEKLGAAATGQAPWSALHLRMSAPSPRKRGEGWGEGPGDWPLHCGFMPKPLILTFSPPAGRRDIAHQSRCNRL